jgi:hypothetical protein
MPSQTGYAIKESRVFVYMQNTIGMKTYSFDIVSEDLSDDSDRTEGPRLKNRHPISPWHLGGLA